MRDAMNTKRLFGILFLLVSAVIFMSAAAEEHEGSAQVSLDGFFSHDEIQIREPAEIVNSAMAVRNVAQKVYDAAETGQGLKAYVAAVLEAFGIKAVGANKLSVAEARLANGRPTLLNAQLLDLANAFADATLVSVDSFITELNKKGARVEARGKPLTSEHRSFCVGCSLA
jgi:hypothetical protein